jgi:hypothetical protein
MTRKLTNKELRNMLLQMKQALPIANTNYKVFLLDYSLFGNNFKIVMQRAKRLAMALHMVIFDRGDYIEFRTWKRGYE